MFDGWARSDTLSAIAVAISVGAFLNSAYQTYMARQRAKEDKLAEEPIVEPSISPKSEWPGWFVLTLRIRNRSDYTLETERLKILRPKHIMVVRYRDITFTGPSGSEDLPKEPPTGLLSRFARGGTTIRSQGSTYPGPNGRLPTDVIQDRYLLFVSSKRSFISSKKLVMSLKLARSNRSMVSSEVIIVITAPVTSAINDT